MLLSVIIPTCNRNELLGRCLQRLIYPVQQLESAAYEIIVSDDDIGHSAKNFIATTFPGVKYVQGPRQGPAANRNEGARHATGDWLVFIDDDVLPENRLLLDYSEAIKNYPELGAFEGSIYPDNWELLKEDMAECPINTSGGLFWSANVCIRRQIFSSLRGFDEGFKIAAQEDQDLYIRLKKITETRFIETARVIHPVRIASLIKKSAAIPASQKNWMYFSLKHGTVWTLLFNSFRSQIGAIVFSIRHRYVRKTLYHTLTLLLILPSAIFYYSAVRRILKSESIWV